MPEIKREHMLHFMNSPAAQSSYTETNTGLWGLQNPARLSTHSASIPFHTLMLSPGLVNFSVYASHQPLPAHLFHSHLLY